MKFLFFAFLILLPLFSFAKSQHVLFLGDSLTAGYGIELENAYPNLLKKMFEKKGLNIKVTNAGTSGSTSASGPSRLKWLLKAKPSVLFLALGANDGLRGVKLESTKKNLVETIKIAKKNNILIILGGMKLPYNYGKDYRQQFEKMYKEISQKHTLYYIPYILKGVGGVKKFNLSDGIHPNEKGHVVIAKNIFPYLQKYLK